MKSKQTLNPRRSLVLAALVVVACTDRGLTDPREAQRFAGPAAASVRAVAISNVTTGSGRAYEVRSGLVSGSSRYIDRSYTFQSVPSALAGATYVRTANDDKNASPASATFLSFDVNEPVLVYVAHDDRVPRPAWLSGWTATAMQLTDNDPAGAKFTLFSKPFAAGRVTLGSNVVAALANVSMYNVVVIPAPAEAPAPALQVTGVTATSGRAYQVVTGGMVPGATRYTDRAFTLTAVPLALQKATFIRTANADKSASPGSTSFLAFTVNQQVVVYVAHDDRVPRPTWLATTNGWTDTGEDLLDSDTQSGNFSLFRKSHPAGTVTLGSNVRVSTDAASMYTVAVVPEVQPITVPVPTVDAQAPSVPQNLAAQAASSTVINLSWSAATDNVGVSGYRIYRGGVHVGTSTSTAYSNSGLSAGTSYVFAVSAVDAAGNESARSASVTVTTPPATAASLANECATPQAGWIWCDDFAQNRLASYFEYVNAGGRFVRESAVGIDGSAGMRATFLAGGIDAGSLKLAFGQTPDGYMRPVDAGTAKYREIYWRVFVRNEAGWTGGGGDKLSRATVFAGANWSQAAIGHVWSGVGVPNRNYLVIDPASGTDTQGNLKTTTYNDFANLRYLGARTGITPLFSDANVGPWYCVETRMRLNDAGQSNGVMEMWINGVLEARASGLNWVGSYSAYGINALFLENYWNSTTSPKQQSRFFDNLVVSTQPIGCGSR